MYDDALTGVSILSFTALCALYRAAAVRCRALLQLLAAP